MLINLWSKFNASWQVYECVWHVYVCLFVCMCVVKCINSLISSVKLLTFCCASFQGYNLPCIKRSGTFKCQITFERAITLHWIQFLVQQVKLQFTSNTNLP